MDSSPLVLDKCPDCGRLVPQGRECPYCSGVGSAGSASRGVGGRAAGSKSRRWILPVVLVILVAAGVGGYFAWPRAVEEPVEPPVAGYQEHFRSITSTLGGASSDLQAALLAYSQGNTETAAHIRALADTISSNTAAARGLLPPSQKSKAHEALVEAAGYYDQGVRHALAAVSTSGAGGGGGGAVFDATRELMQADQHRIKAEAAFGRGTLGVDTPEQ